MHIILQTGSILTVEKFMLDLQVKVACCTVDILKHLSAEEICRNPQGGSKQRLTNLAKHILNQHRHVLTVKCMGLSFD